MKRWVKKVGLLAIGASIIVSGTSLKTPSVQAQSLINPYSKSFSDQIDQLQLPQKQAQLSQSALSNNTLVIKFSKPLTQSEHRLAGGTLVKQFSDLHYAIVKVEDKKNLYKIIGNYQNFTKVLSVTPSTYYKPLAVADPKAAKQYQVDLLHLAKAQSFAGKNKVIVAVIDQGIDSNHPDLKGRLLPSYNAVNPINQGAPDFHGTHVAGIVAADKGNGLGGYGVNPNAKILPIDVFDRGWGATDYAIAQGILYAIDHGAKVINMSLGSPMPSPLIEAAIKKALAKNITVVAAAGNSGDETLSYPAAYEGVISVGSIDKDKNLSSFSTYGTSVDVVAPGDEIYSTIYDYEKKSSYQKLSGTSMAAPMVTGAVSLLLSKYPKLKPYQVEYILEHTAKDLGDKGFDIKFANGLINPVAALQFDLKKLPSIINKPLSENEQLEKAEEVIFDGKTSLSGSITKPFEEKWYKTKVKKGDNLQFILDGAAQFDYKLMINMYSPSEKIQLDVNKVREGKKEGKLFKAPFDGMLIFGVKDVNGSFDDSMRELSKYTLAVEKVAELPADESSLEKPTQIELPFKNETYTLIGDDGDDDYYRFTVKDKEAVKVNLNAIPGVDTSISVYMADQLYPPTDQMSEEEKQAFLSQQASIQNQMSPIYYSNKNGYSEGENLAFMADPEMQYVIKISNKKDNNFGVYDFYMNIGLMETDQNPMPSLAPYKLQIEGKVLPPDEDMFPMLSPGKEQATAVGEVKQQSIIVDSGVNAYDQYIQSIKEGSQRYTIGGTVGGSLQMLEDEDWFTVTPSETGIYQFRFAKDASSVPMMEIYNIQEVKDDQGKTTSYLNQVGSNMSYDYYYSTKLNTSLYTGLKKNETYYIKINPDYYSGNISFDPYQFSSKLAIKNPGDTYEDNDNLDKVKNNLPSGVIEGNFAMPNDLDAFYLQSKSSQIYGVTMDRKTIDEAWRKKYPKELVSPFYGMIAVVEDTNKNRKLDDSEYDSVQLIDHINETGTTFGSFKTEKDKSYIVILSSYVDSPIPITLWPYKLKIGPVNLQDEDKKSIVKNNTPSKPLALKAAGKNKLNATGYLNAGIPYGDEDWYALKLNKDAKGKIELDTGVEVDGTLSLYKDGKLVKKADYYPSGDNEVLYFNLKKGTYYVKVRDKLGNSTLNLYKLTVKY